MNLKELLAPQTRATLGSVWTGYTLCRGRGRVPPAMARVSPKGQPLWLQTLRYTNATLRRGITHA